MGYREDILYKLSELDAARVNPFAGKIGSCGGSAFLQQSAAGQQVRRQQVRAVFLPGSDAGGSRAGLASSCTRATGRKGTDAPGGVLRARYQVLIAGIVLPPIVPHWLNFAVVADGDAVRRRWHGVYKQS